MSRIRINMSHALKDFSQADCERKEPTSGDMPPFRFVPDEPQARAYTMFPVYDPDGKKEMELRVQQYDGEGPIEDLLKWWLSVLKLMAMKPTMTAAEKFLLIPKCLSESGSIQELWGTAKTEAILLEERATNDAPYVELGDKSEDAFEQAILRFFRNWLHEEAGDELKRYL